jgi:aldehyde dehydrogenase (NAD+)
MGALSILPFRDKLRQSTPRRMLIDGRWVDACDGGTWTHVNPATNEAVTTIPVATAADADRAVRAARRAFDEGPWPKLRARERKRLMQRIVDRLAAHADELTELQTLDNAIPISFGRVYRISGHFAADVFDYQAGWIDKIHGETYPQYSNDIDMQFMSVREPVGVVAGITPWNAPLLQFPEKVAPALAAGCCIVMKPSEYASLAALRMGQLIDECDLPPGVFQVLTGGAATGDALVKHPGVDKIAFTGSRKVGEYIQAVAAQGIKRVTLELGGKSAALVFPDAPSVEWASRTAMSMLSMGLSGQVCSITSRALVHESIYDEFIEHARKQVESVRFGDPFDERTTSAPMVNKTQLDKVLGYLARGREEGAQLVFGGERPGGALAAGNWVTPALLANATNRMAIAREEIFGPVLTAIPFKDEAEAIRLANDSDYGLSAGIYTSNVSRAWRVSRALRTGTVGVNGYSFMPNSPFGGFKASGLGREGAFTSIESFTELKTIMLNLAV